MDKSWPVVLLIIGVVGLIYGYKLTGGDALEYFGSSVLHIAILVGVFYVIMQVFKKPKVKPDEPEDMDEP